MSFSLKVGLRLPLQSFEMDVAFEMKSGSLAVLGRSGAGKTSLLEAICGFRPLAHGRIELNGQTLLDSARGIDVRPEKRAVGYVPQDSLLFPHLTVRENLLFGAGAAEAHLGDLVELLELAALMPRNPLTLSTGERQRVALARALATRPRLLILDEPIAALDLQLRQRILPYLLRVRRELLLPLIYVTHQWSEARALCEEVAVLAGGKLVSFGPDEQALASQAAIGEGGEVENFFAGTMEEAQGELCLRSSEGRLLHVQSSGLRAGQFASFAVRADDVIISLSQPQGISARNILRGVIARIERSGDEFLLYVHTDPGEWLAKVTPGSMVSLHLAVNAVVHLVVKANSFRHL